MADSIKGNLKLTGISTLVVLVLVVILQNTAIVETKVLWMSIAMPRALLLAVTVGIGFGAGYVYGRFRRPKQPIAPIVDSPESDRVNEES